MAYESKESMLARGQDLIARFCAANDLELPEVRLADPAQWAFNVCAYYRPTYIDISVKHCAGVGYAGMQWSFPGHSVDRTPYGVLAHELGHHVDVTRSTRKNRYRGDFSIAMRAEVGEAPLTSYCPDDGEWFAEMFRLFVTNPDLLRELRPQTHAALLARSFKPVFADTWRDRLDGAPERTIASIERKLAPKAPVRPRAAKVAGTSQGELL